MDASKEFFACLAFRHASGVGPKTWRRILSHYSSVYEALQDASSWQEKGIAGEHKTSIMLAESWREGATEEYKAARKAGMQVLCWYDPEFPDLLRHIPDPPILLYYEGDASILSNPGVAVVGARDCTEFGLQAAAKISKDLSRVGITIVSGMALGIDKGAHEAALPGLGRTVAVLGNGLDIIYPPENKALRNSIAREGCIVSEFSPGTKPTQGSFPFRNRIISGLSQGVLVAEAANRSGSLITARLATEQGREVFALPGPLGQPTFTGCHKLIKQGAALVENAEDIIHALRFEFAQELAHIADPEAAEDVEADEEPELAITTAAKFVPLHRKAAKDKSASRQVEPKAIPRQPAVVLEKLTLNEEERALMDLLLETDKVHIDSLGRSLGWASNKTSRTLLMLEMRGAVRQLPGMWYLARETGCP